MGDNPYPYEKRNRFLKIYIMLVPGEEYQTYMDRELIGCENQKLRKSHCHNSDEGLYVL